MSAAAAMFLLHDDDEDDENIPTVPSAPGPAFVGRTVYRDACEAQLARAEAENVELRIELAELRERERKNAEFIVPVVQTPRSTGFTVGVVLLIVGALFQVVSLLGHMLIRH